MKATAVLLALLLGLCAPLVRGQDEVAASTLTIVGQPAPDFSATTLAGESVSLSNLRGKVVVLSFFATWCGPCKTELPHIEKDLWQAMRAEGLQVLGVDREEKADVVAPFVNKMSLTFPVVADADRSIYARYAKAYIPRLYIIGRDGRIAFQATGFSPKEMDRIVGLVKAELAKPAK